MSDELFMTANSKVSESTEMPSLRAWFCSTAVKNPAADDNVITI